MIITENFKTVINMNTDKCMTQKYEEFSITKSLCEIYKIRHESGMYWANVTLDYDGEKGRVQIASDYGTWSNYWGSCGCSFKEFLTRIDMYYFAEKVNESEWFDSDATLEVIKKDINKRFASKELNGRGRNNLYERIESIMCDHSRDKTAYMYSMYYDNLFSVFYEPSDIPCITDVSPQFKQFFEGPWQAFIQELKNELLIPNTQNDGNASTL